MMRFWNAMVVAALYGCAPGIGADGLAFAQTSAQVSVPSATTVVVAPAADPDALVRNFDYGQLQKALDRMPESPERDYFAGVLANRSGRIGESIQLLTKALPQLESSEPHRAMVALQSLADDYVKSYRYRDALPAFEKVLRKFPSQLDVVERKDMQDDYQTVRLLKNVPPQTVTFDGAVDLPIHRNPNLGSIETNLTVNGVDQSWLLDTGANFSGVSQSFAARLGVPLSRNTAQTQGVTGAENKLRIAVLPELRIGGATVHNVVLLVLDDKSLRVPTANGDSYQINAVLGYPVLQALKRVTFSTDGHLLAGPASSSTRDGARLYMQGLMPLLECKVGDRDVLFSFDTGAEGSILSDRFRRDFSEDFNGIKKEPFAMGGAGGIKVIQAYYLPEVHLGVGNVPAVLHQRPVAPLMSTDLDKTYGNLGRDLVDSYESFTIDFENMRFVLGTKADKPSK
jgi:hypothetical protein